MNIKVAVSVGALSLWGLSFAAADTAMATHPTSPDAPVEMVSPGRYTASIMPGINGEMADKLEHSFNGISGVENVKAQQSDSSIHFTIKNGSKVPLTSLQNAVTKTDSDAVMSAPLLEHSLAPSPGL